MQVCCRHASCPDEDVKGFEKVVSCSILQGGVEQTERLSKGVISSANKNQLKINEFHIGWISLANKMQIVPGNTTQTIDDIFGLLTCGREGRSSGQVRSTQPSRGGGCCVGFLWHLLSSS